MDVQRYCQREISRILLKKGEIQQEINDLKIIHDFGVVFILKEIDGGANG